MAETVKNFGSVKQGPILMILYDRATTQPPT